MPQLSSPVSAATLPSLGVDPRLTTQYRQQAEHGDAQAQLSLGHLYSQGQGVTRDLAAAVDWYRKAALQGKGLAQLSLGRAYQDGQGTSADPAEAARWYQSVVDQGSTDANTRLGGLYQAGRGVDKDPARAAGLFRTAAADGNSRAQTALGIMLNEGQGIAPDRQEGRALLEQAATQGLEAAKKALSAYGLPLPMPAPALSTGQGAGDGLNRSTAHASNDQARCKQSSSTAKAYYDCMLAATQRLERQRGPIAAPAPAPTSREPTEVRLSPEDKLIFSKAPKVFGIAFDAKLKLPPCAAVVALHKPRQTCFRGFSMLAPDVASDPIRIVSVLRPPKARLVGSAKTTGICC